MQFENPSNFLWSFSEFVIWIYDSEKKRTKFAQPDRMTQKYTKEL